MLMDSLKRDRLVEVRRGAERDELELLDQAGAVVRLVAYGLTADERQRTRERAYHLLQTAGARGPQKRSAP